MVRMYSRKDKNENERRTSNVMGGTIRFQVTTDLGVLLELAKKLIRISPFADGLTEYMVMPKGRRDQLVLQK